MGFCKVTSVVILLMSLTNIISGRHVGLEVKTEHLKELDGLLSFLFGSSKLQRDITNVEITAGGANEDVCDCHIIPNFQAELIITYQAYWPEISLEITGYDYEIGTEYLAGNWVIAVTLTGVSFKDIYEVFSVLTLQLTEVKLTPSIDGAVFSIIYTDNPASVEPAVTNLNGNFVAWVNDNSEYAGEELSEYMLESGFSSYSPFTVPLWFYNCGRNICH